MQTLKTIATIELSSICNLKCNYCINRLLVHDPRRRAGLMTDAIFNRALYWLEWCCKNGTQGAIALNGNGESTLDYKLCDRITEVKKIIGNRKVLLSTNGMNMTVELAKRLKRSGLDQIDLSTHNTDKARIAAQMLHMAGLRGAVTHGPVALAHNWAEQLEPSNCVIILPAKNKNFEICENIAEGRGYIQSEGDVTVCCYDYKNLGSYGHVNDNDLNLKEIKKFELCDNCHQYNEGK